MQMAADAEGPGSATSGIGQRRAAALAEGSPAYRAKRREVIHAAATVFAEKGFEAATLNDVAELVGTDRATLYYYFRGKDELLHEAVRTGTAANLTEVERILKLDEPPDEKLRLIVERLLFSYEEDYPYMYVYIQEHMRKVASEDDSWAKEMTRLTRRFESVSLQLIKQAVAEGRFREDVRPELAANALFGMINWTHRWFRPGKRLSSEELSASFWAIFFDGMRDGA
jgi:TetR/AcrR family transcriptional regulator, cholesterol catabolism regulator